MRGKTTETVFFLGRDSIVGKRPKARNIQAEGGVGGGGEGEGGDHPRESGGGPEWGGGGGEHLDVHPNMNR